MATATKAWVALALLVNVGMIVSGGHVVRRMGADREARYGRGIQLRRVAP